MKILLQVWRVTLCPPRKPLTSGLVGVGCLVGQDPESVYLEDGKGVSWGKRTKTQMDLPMGESGREPVEGE